MADTTTVEDWKQAAANLEAQISALEKQQRELEEAFFQQNATTAALRKQRNDLGGANRNSPEGIELGRQINESNLKAQQIQNQVKQLSIQIVNLDAELQKAERQAGIAQTATPNTKKNTPPANPDPGPNTAAEPVSPSVPTESVPKTVSEPQQQAFLDANAEPLSEPPIDEFAGVDEAVAAQENALKEPPLLSDEEVNQYLNEAERPNYDSPPEIDTSQDAAENAKFLRQQEEANPPASDNPEAKGSARGLTGKTKKTRQQATAQDNANYNLLKDWRVKLSLAPGANYLYKGVKVPGILAPLAKTDGVVFPYTPTVTVNYTAGYDPTELIHSNYKVFQYRSSAVDSISITGDFTAQDTFEANYLLAVIHFFRSVTKMFYGQDSNPVNGVPPPLCYLTGYGAFNFDHHPLVISNFTCTFPNDVDYIRATTHDTMPAGSNTNEQNVPDNSETVQGARMAGANVQSGARPNSPEWSTARTFSGNTGSTVDPTYVPTKMSIQVTAYPIVSRNDISRRFSLRDYATGKLLRGSKSPTGGGIW